MSKAQLKKALASMSVEEITEMICELYDARPEAKEYLEFWLKPDLNEELEKYKVKIYRLFFTPSGKPRKRPTTTAIKKELKYFSSLCFDSEMIAELYLYLCEIDLEWRREKRNPAATLKSTQGNIELCRKYIEASGLEDRFAIRLERIEEEYQHSAHIVEVKDGHGNYGWRRWFR